MLGEVPAYVCSMSYVPGVVLGILRNLCEQQSVQR